MISPLTKDDKGQLKRLNENKPLIIALKKLFLNTATKSKLLADVNVLDIVQEAFYQLSIIQPEIHKGASEENLV